MGTRDSTEDLESPSPLEPTLIIEKSDALAAQSSATWSFTSVSIVLVWIFLSTSVILFNKYIMDNRNFTITLTCWHLTFAACATQLLARTTRLVEGRKRVKMTGRIYLRAILPIGAMYSGSLVCSNLPYMTLSVAFIQMLKGMDPAIVLLAMWALGLASPTGRTWFNICIIIMGVTMTAFGEIKFVLSGFLFQVASRFFESFRLALIQKVLSGEENKMDPIDSLYYFSPVCAIMIGSISAFTELPRLRLEDIKRTGIGLLVANATVAFLLNVAGVILIGQTSALMLPLSGVLKTIFLILASVIIWGTVVTPTQLIGCMIATIGLLYYSLGKEQLHGYVFPWNVQRRTHEKGVKGRRLAKRKFAIVFTFLVASAGAAGGWYSGYNIEWNPRVYWYSAQRLAGGSLTGKSLN